MNDTLPMPMTGEIPSMTMMELKERDHAYRKAHEANVELDRFQLIDWLLIQAEMGLR